MKKLIIAALMLVSFSAADFAQTVKKNDPSIMQFLRKAAKKEQTKVMTLNKERGRGAAFAFVVTVVFATVFFVSFFAGLFYTSALLTECMAGFVALFITGQKKGCPPLQQLSI